MEYLKVYSPPDGHLIKEVPMINEKQGEKMWSVAYDIYKSKVRIIKKHKRIEILEKVVIIMKLNLEKTYVLFIIFLFFGTTIISQTTKKTIYLIPGQGSDYRIFKYFNFPNCDTVHINYMVPGKDDTMRTYAKKLASKINTSQPFSIIGVSLGGMLAVEISQILTPDEVIIISSAKCYDELPGRYKFMTKFPINRIFGGEFLRFAAPTAQIIVEPDSKKERELFVSMLKSKDELFMKRSLNMIINWDRTVSPPEIIHIHGNNDHTIPLKNIKTVNHIITNGSHMMTLTRGKEIKTIIELMIK